MPHNWKDSLWSRTMLITPVLVCALTSTHALHVQPLACALPTTHYLHRCVSPSCLASETGQAKSLVSVTSLASAEAYNSLLASTADTSRVAVIQFTSASCAACKKMRPQFERMAEGWPEVEFYDLVFETCGKSHFKSCGVRGVPHVHILAGGEAVESFSCPARKLGLLENTLYARGFAQLAMHRGYLSGRRWRRMMRQLRGDTGMVSPARAQVDRD